MHSPPSLTGLLSMALALASITSAAVIPVVNPIDFQFTAAQTFTEITTTEGIVFQIYDAPVHAPTTRNPTAEATDGLAKRWDNCGDASFQTNTNNGHAAGTVHDCNLLRDFFRSNCKARMGLWATRPGDWIKGFSHESCLFMARSSNLWGPSLGNEDMADLTRDTVAHHESNGRAATQGVLGCPVEKPDGGWEVGRVEWAVTHV